MAVRPFKILWLPTIIAFLVGTFAIGSFLYFLYWLLVVRRRRTAEGHHDHGPWTGSGAANSATVFSPMFWGRGGIHPFIRQLRLRGLPSHVEVVGRGACGEVCKVDVLVASQVLSLAVKKIEKPATEGDDAVDLDAEGRRLLHFRLRQVGAEIATVGRMRHPNLVRLLAHVQKPECHYLVYEFMNHGSLHDALRRGHLEWPARYKVALGVAAGLEYLHMVHRPRVIHRDLKPANILLDHELNARITDFGLAKVVHGVLSGSLETVTAATSNVAGTVGYIAPEYYQRLACTDKCDVYSFGVILAVLVTGRFPTDGYFGTMNEADGIVQWVRRVLQSADPKTAVDEKLAGNGWEEQMLLVLKVACFCTANDPNERPNSRDVRCMLSQLGDYDV